MESAPRETFNRPPLGSRSGTFEDKLRKAVVQRSGTAAPALGGSADSLTLTAATLQRHHEATLTPRSYIAAEADLWRAPATGQLLSYKQDVVQQSWHCPEGSDPASYPNTPASCTRAVPASSPAKFETDAACGGRHPLKVLVSGLEREPTRRSQPRKGANKISRETTPEVFYVQERSFSRTEGNADRVLESRRRNSAATPPAAFWWEECTERDGTPLPEEKGLFAGRRDDLVRYDPRHEVEDDQDAACDDMCGVSGRSKAELSSQMRRR